MPDEPDTTTSGREADWAELFFDLVFVLAVAEIDEGFVSEPSFKRALITLALFVPVWWAWVGFAFFATRFPAEDRKERLALLAASGASLVMAVGLGSAVEGDGVAFAVGYGLLRAILASLYLLNGRRRQDDSGVLARGYAKVFGTGAAFWIVSIAAPAPFRYFLWAIAILIDLSAPVVLRQLVGRAAVDPSHLPQRFGTFVLIVLGETLAATGTSAGDADWDAATVVVAAGCFLAACAVWWSYFDRVGVIFARPVSTRSDSGVYARDLYSYGHFPLVVGIVAIAAGAKLMILSEHVETGGVALALGMALSLAALGMLQLAIVRDGVARVAEARLVAAAACLPVIVLAAVGLGRVWIAILVAFIGVAVCGWVQMSTRPQPSRN